MPPDLFWLTLTALLAASLWIPYIVGVNTAPAGSLGAHDPADFTRPLDPALHRPWVHRAYRAHLNLIEQGLPFALLVVIAHLAGASGALTAWTAAAFFWLRVVHAAGMISGTIGFPARPVIFTLGWVCCMAVGVAILTA